MTSTLAGERVDTPMFDTGEWLIERRRALDASEAAWLDVLAEFDRAARWALDGQLSGADWLVWRCKMARSTAFEKLRVATSARAKVSAPTATLVHIVSGAEVASGGQAGRAELIDGTPISVGDVARLACDASLVTRSVAADGEPLNMGRKTRTWNQSQRRAITVRDGGHCRMLGCQRRLCDIHHLQPWNQNGPTDIANGALVCTHHHTLLHQGFQATGDANHDLTFLRPDGTVLGSTRPGGQLPTLL